MKHKYSKPGKAMASLAFAAAAAAILDCRAVDYPSPGSFAPVWQSIKPGESYSWNLPTAALLGNGSLGVVNGGDKNRKLFVLTRGDIWSCGNLKPGEGDDSIRPISFADLEILPGPRGVGENANDRLDIETARLSVSGDFGKGRASLECFVAAGDDLFVVRGVIAADDEWTVRLKAHDGRKGFPDTSGASTDAIWARRATLDLSGQSAGGRKGWTREATAALSAAGAARLDGCRAVSPGVAEAKLKIRAGRPFAIVVSGDVSRRFAMESLADTEKRHLRWWKDWWGKCRIAIGDGELERFWYGQIYLLGSTVRKGGFPPGLYGVWQTNDQPGWRNDYHLNYNYVATCYGCLAANRCEAADPLPDPLLDYLPQAVRNAKELLPRIDTCAGRTYSNTRAYLERRKDLAGGIADAALYPVSLGPWGTAPEGDGQMWSQISDGAFQCAFFCTCWEYTLDRDYLVKIWPLLEKTANFFMAWREKEELPGGEWRYNIYDSLSEGSGLQKNSSAGLGAVKHLFETLVAATPELRAAGIDVPESRLAAWTDMRDRLAPLPAGVFPIDGVKTRMLSGVENADGSANPSGGNAVNLESIIPGEVFAFDVAAEFRELAVNAVKGNLALHGGARAWSGINQPPKLFATAIRAGYPAADVIAAFKQYQLHRFGQKNFHLHDGVHGVEKIGAMEFVNSMLLQCDHGFVKVFPNWTGDDAKFENMRAKGGFLISAEMKGGTTVCVEITAEKGGRLRLVDPFGGKEPPAGWARGKTRRSGEATLERDFAPGERSRLAP